MNLSTILIIAIASLGCGALTFGFANVMVSVLALQGKPLADALARVFYVMFGSLASVGIILAVYFSRSDCFGLIIQIACIMLGLRLGFRSAYKNARRAAAAELAVLTEMTGWAQANFARLDVNGDTVICALDLAHFSVQDDLTDADRKHLAKLSRSVDDIGHEAVSRSLQNNPAAVAFIPFIPKVVSETDLAVFIDRKKALWAGWLN